MNLTYEPASEPPHRGITLRPEKKGVVGLVFEREASIFDESRHLNPILIGMKLGYVFGIRGVYQGGEVPRGEKML